jgi:hypothetical protein
MDVISSRNETSAHALENGSITFIFCSLNEKPLILRLYAKGFTVLPGTTQWETYSPHYSIYPSTRQLILAYINFVQTSCGFGVPRFHYVGQRDVHFSWDVQKGEEGLQEYVRKNNLVSLDGLPTNVGLQGK